MTPRRRSMYILCENAFLCHCSIEFQEKAKTTRQNKKQLEIEAYKCGCGDRNGLYRNCFVCQQIGSKQALTKKYCGEYCVHLYSSRHLKTSKDGDANVCWNELHASAKIVRRSCCENIQVIYLLDIFVRSPRIGLWWEKLNS
jgi:hypothetical protein